MLSGWLAKLIITLLVPAETALAIGEGGHGGGHGGGGGANQKKMSLKTNSLMRFKDSHYSLAFTGLELTRIVNHFAKGTGGETLRSDIVMMVELVLPHEDCFRVVDLSTRPFSSCLSYSNAKQDETWHRILHRVRYINLGIDSGFNGVNLAEGMRQSDQKK